MEIDEEIEYLIKIIIIGETGVGKSSLISQYTKNIFNESTRSTIGVDFSSLDLKINNKKIKV